MSDTSQGEGWWIASDGRWYAPELHPDRQRLAPEVAITSAAVTDIGADATHTAHTEPETDSGLPLAAKLGLVGLVAIAALGFLAFRLVTGSNAGGADQPQLAVQQLIDSVNERDAVGFVAALDPDEIDAWFGSFEPITQRFADAGLYDVPANSQVPADWTDFVDGLDFAFTGPGGERPAYDVEMLDDDQTIARVRISGLDLTVQTAQDDSNAAFVFAMSADVEGFDLRAFDGARISLRDTGDSTTYRATVPNEPTELGSFDVPLDLIAVKRDGRWHVSIAYSIAEQIRLSEAPETQPNFGASSRLVDSQRGGADTPQEALEDFMSAFELLRYEEMIRLTDPYSMPLLHDYQPLIDDEVNPRERADAVREMDLRFDRLDFGETMWDNRTVVTVEQLGGRVGGGSFDVDFSTWCGSIIDDVGEVVDGCLAEDLLDEALAEFPEFDGTADDVIPDDFGFVMVERNGRWYINPLGTLGYWYDQIAESAITLIEQELEDAGSAENAFEDFALQPSPLIAAEPVVREPFNGIATAAFDLAGVEPAPSDDGYDIAIVRVSTSESTRLPGSTRQLDADSWMVVYDHDLEEPEIPAIALATTGEVTFEVLTEQVELGADGWTAQIGDDGKPILVEWPGGSSTLVGGSYIQVPTYDTGSALVETSQVPNSGTVLPQFYAQLIISGEPGDQVSIQPNS